MRRIGLVGAGSMGSLHARVIRTSGRTTLAWIADPSEAVGRPLAERLGVEWFPEPQLGTVDAVVVAAPTQYHHQIGMAVLDAGLPMLLEKPLADALDETIALIARADELDLPLMCGLLERFNPAIRTAMDIVDEPLHLRTIRHSPYVERIRTGVASDLLIHDADVAIRLFGQPTHVRGLAAHVHPKSDATSEDVVEAVMTFPAGRIAALSVSRMSQRKVREIMIGELDRMIEVDLLRQDITIYRHIGDTAPTDDDGLGYRQQTIIDIPVIRHQGEPLALQLQHFLSVLDGDVDAAAERRSILPAHQAVHDAMHG